MLCWCGFAAITLPESLAGWWPEIIYAKPAVEMFIILSGFVISFMLGAKRQSYWAFMRGRFFRIYPVYIICLLFALVTIHLMPSILHGAPWRDTMYYQWLGLISHSELGATPAHVLLHLTLLNGLFPRRFLFNSTGTLLPPAWSISLEWQYYLVAPFIALWVRSKWGLSLLAGVVCLGMKFGGHWGNPHQAFLAAQLPLFLIGIGSYHLYVRCAIGPGCSRRMAATIGVLLMGALVLSLDSIALAGWGIVFGSILLRGDTHLGPVAGTVRRFLLLPWLQWLGRVSYPLYLVHWPIIVTSLFMLLRCKPAIAPGEALCWLLAVALPVSLIVAGLLHRFIEAPMMRFGKRGTISGLRSEPVVEAREKMRATLPSVPESIE
jgi:peptidoglycan/LPS O-acetylase OafA/YrhL